MNTLKSNHNADRIYRTRDIKYFGPHKLGCNKSNFKVKYDNVKLEEHNKDNFRLKQQGNWVIPEYFETDHLHKNLK